MSSSSNPLLRDILAGCACGVTAVIVSHPLETVITQKKINSPEVYRNVFHSIQTIYKRQGLVDGFYRGNLNLPMISPAFVMSTQFFLYGQIKRLLLGDTYGSEQPIENYFLAGALTGLGSSLIETPIGLVNGQIYGHLYLRHTHVFDFHIKDCCKYIYETNGGLRGFYKGYSATLICSMTTLMFYFGGYEYVKCHLYRRQNRFFFNANNDKHLRIGILLSGAIGGIGAWSICHPLDRIRSEIQADDLRRERRKYGSYLDCVKQMYQQDGIRMFYRGFLSCILKAVPINAACFLAYEEVYRLMK